MDELIAGRIPTEIRQEFSHDVCVDIADNREEFFVRRADSKHENVELPKTQIDTGRSSELPDIQSQRRLKNPFVGDDILTERKNLPFAGLNSRTNDE